MKISTRHATIAARDGWTCFYCDIPLAHGDEGWVTKEESWDHCGCGRHDLMTDPCPEMVFLADGYGNPEADHVVSRSGGGPDGIPNLVLSCGRCNRKKSTRTAIALLLELAAA